MNRKASKDETLAEMQSVIDALNDDADMNVLLLVMQDTTEVTAMRMIVARANDDDIKRMLAVASECMNDVDKPTHSTQVH